MMRCSKQSRPFEAIDCFLDEVTVAKNVLEVLQPNRRKWTPLMMASPSSDMTIIELLLVKRFDIPPYERSTELLHSICLAMVFEKSEVLRYLFKRREDDLMLSPIMTFASCMGQLETIEILLEIDMELSFVLGTRENPNTHSSTSRPG